MSPKGDDKLQPLNPNEKRFYVYIWVNDDKDEIFYVGKGSKNRYKDKGRERNKWFQHIVNKYNCHSEILVDGLTNDEALYLEREVEIRCRKYGCNLVNLTECGGAPPICAGENNPNFGHKWSDEMKEKASKYFKESGSHAGKRNGRAMRVMCVETGDIFDTQKDASEYFKIKNVSSIYHALKEKRFVAKGLHFVSGNLVDELDTEEKRKSYLRDI